MNTDIKTIKFRTRVGNKYMILTRPLTGEFVQYGANTGELAYKVIVSCADLGIQREDIRDRREDKSTCGGKGQTEDRSRLLQSPRR